MNLAQFNPLKCLVYADKINRILDGEFPAPVVLNLDLTNECNFRCQWCYVKDYISNEIEMPRDTASKIINEIADLGTRSILFTGGGEPTLHPNFSKMVKLATVRKLEIGLTTNGTQLHRLVNYLSFENFKYVRISFDAGYEQTYMRIHKARDGDFLRVLLAARDLSLKRCCQVGMAFLATPFNYLEIPVALKWAENYDFDYLEIRPTVFTPFLSDDQLKKAIELSDNLVSDSVKIYSIRHRFDSLLDKRTYLCKSTPLVAVVTADARLNLCCQYRGDPKYQWGDLSKKTFKSLWGDRRHKKLIRSIDVNDCPTCRMISYNQIIEEVFVKGDMHLGFL